MIAQFPVDFSPATPNLIPTFAAIVDVDSGTATFNVRLSVDAGRRRRRHPRHHHQGAPRAARSCCRTSAPSFVPLTAPALIKITAANDNAAVSCRIRSKTVTLRAA